LDARGIPIPGVTAFLRHFADIERSPNTIRGYAHDLDHFHRFLTRSGLTWEAVDNEVLGRFIRFLRTEPSRLGADTDTRQRSETTVNRALSAVTSYALFLSGTTNDGVYERLSRTAVLSASRFEYGTFVTSRVGPRMKPHATPHRLLEEHERQAIVGSCRNLRDRFLFTVLDQTGMRAGQALLLRHTDVLGPRSSIAVRRHDDDTSTERNKSRAPAIVPVSADVIRLYAAYMHTEYRLIDSDYVFVNLYGRNLGAPMTYANLDQIVRRLRAATGIKGWSAHSFRHTFVTRLLSAGVPIETVSYLATHLSVLTTIDTYNHPNERVVRQQLLDAGVWPHG
jgi:site-specific recombinase XerD